jgi:hypothetical protein
MSAFRTFSNILQLRTESYVELKQSRRGMRYAVWQLIIVGLVAGLGIWIGLPALLQKPLLSERIADVAVKVDEVEQKVLPVADEYLNAVSQEQLGAKLAAIVQSGEQATAETLSSLVDQASVSVDSMGEAITEQAQELSADERVKVQQALDGIKALAAAREAVPPAQITQLLSLAKVSASDVVANLKERASGGRLDQLSAQIGQSSPQLEQWLTELGSLGAGLQAQLARAVVLSNTLVQAASRVGLSAEQIATIRADLKTVPETAKALLAKAGAEADRVEPPLGGRPSRVIRMFGEWISTPLQFLAEWAFFALALLAVVKLLGGRGTTRQHVIGMLLASAPLFLLFFTFVPNLSPTMPASFYEAFQVFGRTLGIFGIAWAGLIVLKSMSVTHEIGAWRAAGAIALTWATIHVIAPIVTLFAVKYILRG